MSKLYIPILLFASTSIFAQQQYKGSLQYANQTPVSLADVIILKDDQIIARAYNQREYLNQTYCYR